MVERIGHQFGNYRLAQLLGQGGFADVYLGKHLYLDRQAAIKIVQARLTQRDQEAFLKEARTIADLQHPHIIHVLDFGVEGNEQVPFLVMEFAPHGSLRQRYPQGARLPLNEVVSYVKQVASALQYAHERKVIHRDVKPENMLLGEKNEMLLSDFGIAVVAQNSRSGQDINGTVAYMAPEQLQGKPQPASDQYALAIVAYELLSGELPFKGSFAEMGSQHLFAPLPSLREKVPTLSPDVEAIVQTALAKDPQRRFAVVSAFANALEQAALANDALTERGRQPPARSYQGLVPPPPPGMPVVPVPTPPPPPASFSAPGSGQYIERPANQYPAQPAPSTLIQQPAVPGASSVPGNIPPAQPQTPAPPVENYRPAPQGAVTPPLQPSGLQRPIHLPQDARAGNVTPDAPTRASQIGQAAPTLEARQAAKAGKKPAGNRLVPLLAVLIVVLLLVTTSSILYAFVWKGTLPWASSSASASQTTVIQQPTSTPDLAGTANAQASATAQAEATTAATVSATSTAQPTTTPGQTYSESVKNLTFACTDNCTNHIAIVLQSIVIDTGASSMSWNFQVTNTGSAKCDMEGSLALKDPTGNEFDANNGTFAQSTGLDPTQELPLTAVFSDVPQKNTTYLAELSTRCNGGQIDNFRVEQFKFTTGK